MAATANGTTNGAHANGTANGGTTPQIHLYTNHRCPYAHRAHIALQELGLEFEETIIDLDNPRPQWYLDINPRGLVPSIKYSIPGVMEEETLIESAIVSQFLCDSFPSHLLPSPTDSPTAPLKRAKINFFVDTFTTKLTSHWMNVMKAQSSSDKESKCQEWVAAIEKEVEPLLADAAPFFGGSKQLTFAEVMVAPFLVRWYSHAEDGEMIPNSFIKMMDGLPNFGRWAKAVRENESVLKIYDGEHTTEAFKKKMKKVFAEQK